MRTCKLTTVVALVLLWSSLVYAQAWTAFVSTGTIDGDDGIAIADAICRQEAIAAGFEGDFVALLSTSGRDAKDRLSAGSFVQPDYDVIGTDKDDLFDDTIGVAINLQADGDTSAVDVWTATLADGTADSNTCGDWALTTGTALKGLSSATDTTYLNNGSQTCATSSPFYCVQRTFSGATFGAVSACAVPPCDLPSTFQKKTNKDWWVSVTVSNTATAKVLCKMCENNNCAYHQIGADLTASGFRKVEEECDDIKVQVSAYTSGAVQGWLVK